MNARSNSLRVPAAWALLLVVLILVSCLAQPENSSSPNLQLPLGTPEDAGSALTQVQENAVNRAAAAAEMMRENAQATLDSANATLSAAQIQQQNSADAIAAQVTAAALIAQANALATVNSANSTLNAAATQDEYRRIQVYDQQIRDEIAAHTQTAVADLIATKTEFANIRTQGNVEQLRLRQADRQAPITFMITWCLPPFILILAGLGIWGVWRWLKIKQTNQILAGEQARNHASLKNANQLHRNSNSSGNEYIHTSYSRSKPDNQMHRWMDEVKRKLMDPGKDKYDKPGG